MKKLIVISVLLLANSIVRAQHIPILTQYLFNPVPLNPAFTGSDDAMSFVAAYRAQWVGFAGAPQTGSFVVHAPMRKMNSSFGLQFFADQIGVTHQNGVYLSYAYKLRFKKAALKFGIAGGMQMYTSNYNSLDRNDTYDASLVTNMRGIMPDFSFGLHYYRDKFFASFSLPFFLTHYYNGSTFLNKNEINNYNYTLGSGYRFDVNENIKIKPSFLLKYHYAAAPQIDLNLMATLSHQVEAGFSYRTSDSFIFLFKYLPVEQFQLMYSFGLPVSSVKTYSFGSHEISLKYILKYKSQIQGPRNLGW